jgi:DNA-binding GntR family transcriptional regulator
MVAGTDFVDLHGYVVANRAFHEFQVDLAGNELMSEIYRRISVHVLTERILAGSRSAGDSSSEHRRIVEACEAGDLDAAPGAIRANVETAKRLGIAAIERAGGVL